MTRRSSAPALPDRAAIESAAQFLATLVPPTPQYVWPQVAAAFGTEVWLKHENHTPIGAFKARSAAMYFQKLMQREPGCRGVITATRGNHGQAVGLAARRFKLPATVYVPHGNSVEKNTAMRALGVKLVEHGHDFQEAREEAARVGARDGLHMVPAFHADIVLGVTTYWAELFRAAPDLDVVYVPIGQGSGVCAAAAARNVYSPRTKIVGVVSAHAPAFREILRRAAGDRSAGGNAAGRRHGLPQAGRRRARDHAREREPHRRSHRRRARRCDARHLRHDAQRRRRRRRRGIRRRLARARVARRPARRHHGQRRQCRHDVFADVLAGKY